jgi:hypothetical protein
MELSLNYAFGEASTVEAASGRSFDRERVEVLVCPYVLAPPSVALV